MENTLLPMPDEFVEIDIFGEKETKGSVDNAVKPEGQIRRLYRILTSDPIEAFVHEDQYVEIAKDIFENICKKTRKTTRISLRDIAAIYPCQEEEILFILKTFDHQLHIRFDNTFQVILNTEDSLYNKTREISDYKIYLPGKIRERAKGQFLKEIQQYWNITADMAIALFESTYFKMPMKGGFQKIHAKQTVIVSNISEEQLNALKRINPPTPKFKPECAPVLASQIPANESRQEHQAPANQPTGVRNDQKRQQTSTIYTSTNAVPIKQDQRGNGCAFHEDQVAAYKYERNINEINLLPDELIKWKTIIIAYEELPMPAKICALYKIFRRSTPDAIRRNKIDTPAALYWVLQSRFQNDFSFLKE